MTAQSRHQRSSIPNLGRRKSAAFRLWCTVGTTAWLVATGEQARGDSVGMLVQRLSRHSSYKVRSTAALVLSKSCDTRAFDALVRALNSDSSPEVRATAASSLARLGLLDCVPALKKAARSGDAQVKSRAKAAMARLCPSVGRRRFYVNLDRISYKGPSQGKIAVKMVRCRLGRILRSHSDVLVAWPKCKKPSDKALRRKRVKGFYLDVVVKIKARGSNVLCKVTPTFWSYPRSKLLTTGGGAKVKITGNLSPGILDMCLNHAVGSLKGDIVQTLQRL